MSSQQRINVKTLSYVTSYLIATSINDPSTLHVTLITLLNVIEYKSLNSDIQGQLDKLKFFYVKKLLRNIYFLNFFIFHYLFNILLILGL